MEETWIHSIKWSVAVSRRQASRSPSHVESRDGRWNEIKGGSYEGCGSGRWDKKAEGFINQSTLYACVKSYHEPQYSAQLICESHNKKIQVQILPALLPERHSEGPMCCCWRCSPSGWATPLPQGSVNTGHRDSLVHLPLEHLSLILPTPCLPL